MAAEQQDVWERSEGQQRDGVKTGEEQRGKVNHRVSQGIILVWSC